jgi:dihydroneopterin aldolase
MDKIFIKGLALEATIGVYEHEKGVKQPLKVDLEMFVDSSLSANSDLIKDTVDYDLVAQRVAQLVAQSHCELLESLAQYVVQSLLDEFAIARLIFTVYKPQAINNAETVGITIERVKEAK